MMIYNGKPAFEVLDTETVARIRTFSQTEQTDFTRLNPGQKQLGGVMDQVTMQFEQIKLSANWQSPRESSTASALPLFHGDHSVGQHRSTAPEYRLVQTGSSSQGGPSSVQNFSVPFRRQPVPTTDPLAYPTVASDPVIVDSEWKKRDPPRELLYTPPDTDIPFEIESVLEASIETVQNQLVEELSRQEEERSEREKQSKAESSGRASVDDALSNFANFWSADEAENLKQKNKEPEVLLPTTERERHPYRLQLPENAYSATEGDWRPEYSKHLSTASSSNDSGYISGSVESGSLRSKGFIFRNFFKRTAKGKEKSKATTLGASASDSVPRAEIKECVSCLEDFDTTDVVTLSCHSYCFGCFHELISNSVTSETYWPPKCCLNEIPSSSIFPNIKPQLKKRYEKVVEERSIPANERVYCSKPSCGVFIPPRNIQKLNACAACPQCRTKTCTTCYGAYHNTSECPNDAALQATLKLATESGWRRCIGCQAVVEHNEGCLHMTCKCKAQFCYICGTRWRTCACTDGDLAAYLASAASRIAQAAASDAQTDRERIARERAQREAERARQAEHNELLEILQEIEEYETEEAVRLATQEETRRLNAISAREEIEEKKVREISKRFYQLQLELDGLHDMQRVALSERWAHEDEALKNKMQKAARERRKELMRIRAEREANGPSQQSIDMRTRHAMESQVIEWSMHEAVQKSQTAMDDLARERGVRLSNLQAKWMKELRQGEDVESRGNRVEEVLMEALRKQFEESDETQEWKKNMSLMASAHKELRKDYESQLNLLEQRYREELLVLEKTTQESEESRARVSEELELKRKLEGLRMDRGCDERWLREVARERATMLRTMELEVIVVDQE